MEDSSWKPLGRNSHGAVLPQASHGMLKNAIRRLIGPATLGRVDYYRFPQYRSGCGGPFNGQQGRREIFHAILENCSPASILETGTFRGTTTEYMARETGLPIYTAESDPRFAGYAKARLRGLSQVTIMSMDSRAALRRLSTRVKSPFCYLDAHWNDDLPLRDELSLVFAQWPDAVVMIDDFEVPGDPGYGFDEYGDGRKLCLEYLRGIVGDWALFFPSLPSAKETGLKRGCVVLAVASSDQAWRLRQVAGLREYCRNDCPR